MGPLRRYWALLVGAALVILIVIAGMARRDRPRGEPQVPAEVGAESPARAANAARPAVMPRRQRPRRVRESAPTQQRYADTDVGKESDRATEEPTEGEEPEEDQVDPDKARAQALEQVREFNAELASTLRTFNPNARKVRIKAKQLRDRAEEIERWIQEQDRMAGGTADEDAWKAQREVWVQHAAELKKVATRLSATRGTRRKVRILAREISEKLDE